MSTDKNSAVNGITATTLQNIKELVEQTEVVGKPITIGGGTTIIPVSRVTMGFASGGSDIGTKTAKEMFGGGSGAGVTVTPIAFIIISDSGVRMLQLNSAMATVDNIVQSVPEWIDKVSDLVKK